MLKKKYTMKGDVKMKQVNNKLIKRKLNEILAKATYKTAEKGAGLASRFGWYQPKVPQKLAK